jgi:hypothetical protein
VFCPKKYPLFTLLWAIEIDTVMLADFDRIFFLQEIFLFELSFYETTRFFWKKCKNGHKIEFSPNSTPFFAYFYRFLGNMELTFFFVADFGQIFYSSRKYVYSNCVCTNQLNFFEKCKNGLKNGVLPKTKSIFFAYFYSFFCFPNRDFTRRFLRRKVVRNFD